MIDFIYMSFCGPTLLDWVKCEIFRFQHFPLHNEIFGCSSYCLGIIISLIYYRENAIVNAVKAKFLAALILFGFFVYFNFHLDSYMDTSSILYHKEVIAKIFFLSAFIYCLITILDRNIINLAIILYGGIKSLMLYWDIASMEPDSSHYFMILLISGSLLFEVKRYKESIF